MPPSHIQTLEALNREVIAMRVARDLRDGDYVNLGIGIPTLVSNFVPMDQIPAWSKDYIFIPMKLWSPAEHRLLTFREMLALTAHCDDWGTAYTQSRIEVIDNTPEEITAVATEMDGRINGTWESTAEDDALSKEFWSLFKPSPWNRFFACRIGTEFLRQNKDLLR